MWFPIPIAKYGDNDNHETIHAAVAPFIVMILCVEQKGTLGDIHAEVGQSVGMPLQQQTRATSESDVSHAVAELD